MFIVKFAHHRQQWLKSWRSRLWQCFHVFRPVDFHYGIEWQNGVGACIVRHEFVVMWGPKLGPVS